METALTRLDGLDQLPRLAMASLLLAILIVHRQPGRQLRRSVATSLLRLRPTAFALDDLLRGVLEVLGDNVRLPKQVGQDEMLLVGDECGLEAVMEGELARGNG